jgi:hypothetical protein
MGRSKQQNKGKTRKEEKKSGGAEFWKFLELIF